MGWEQLASFCTIVSALNGDSFCLKSPKECKDSCLNIINLYGNVELEQIDVNGFLRFYEEACVLKMPNVELNIDSM